MNTASVNVREAIGERDDPAWFDLISLPVVGLNHRGEDARKLAEQLEPGECVLLVREPTNATRCGAGWHDPRSIRVRARGRAEFHLPPAWIGYIPAASAGYLSALIDNGHTLRAHVEYVDAAKASITVTLRARKAR